MKPTTLGSTDLICPPIIYGTSYLGNLYRELSWEEKLLLMQEWFRVSDGKVMIDSAGKYGAGLALEVIGKGLLELGILPRQITISNKLGWYRVPLETEEPTFEPGAWANLEYDAVQRISYDGILDCWKQGCELLGGIYKPEVVSVHDPDEYLAAASDEADREKRLEDILGAYKALFELKEKGEVKAVGIGSKDWLVIKELYENVKFDWVMFANKFTVYHHPKAIVDFLKQLGDDGVGVINSAIFNAGFLTGGDYFDYRLVSTENPDDKPLFDWREKFFAVCEQFDVTPGDACLKFALSAPQIQAVALNPSKPRRMLHNKALLDMEFPAAFWEELKAQGIVDSEYPYL
ncbi:aldo/keto reductase [Mangrovibacterium diazotrophicum]|uniref:D-threo-aldose 1-dehydrogenase n=1 Tax=Mangrovibacterium diazotrophicum TaxID=1261403 RepID=A0A419W345_9BACT|nr:aldo/keto reductase [Mangrovibacterium diazotrophicum]RKD89883.1 D-threo-aldose 1-dehydrogenase [Mangrovibacterium diazotrophicum]